MKKTDHSLPSMILLFFHPTTSFFSDRLFVRRCMHSLLITQTKIRFRFLFPVLVHADERWGSELGHK
jgi:hypothetical protein